MLSSVPSILKTIKHVNAPESTACSHWDIDCIFIYCEGYHLKSYRVSRILVRPTLSWNENLQLKMMTFKLFKHNLALWCKWKINSVISSRVLNFPYISLYFFPRTIFSSSSRLVRYTDKCMESSKHDWTLSGTATTLQLFFPKILFLVPNVFSSWIFQKWCFMKIIWHRISIQTLLFQACLLTRQNGVENRDQAYYKRFCWWYTIANIALVEHAKLHDYIQETSIN